MFGYLARRVENSVGDAANIFARPYCQLIAILDVPLGDVSKLVCVETVTSKIPFVELGRVPGWVVCWFEDEHRTHEVFEVTIMSLTHGGSFSAPCILESPVLRLGSGTGSATSLDSMLHSSRLDGRLDCR